jgi:hypothetical protein
MKRFTETDKWRDAWFRKLSPACKCLWQYMVDNCDQAGVIDIDWELASFQIGAKVSEKDLASFDRQVSRLANGKLWISSFVKFQYGVISRDCKPHTPVFKAIERHSIPFDSLYSNSPKAIEGYHEGFQSLQDKEKDKETETNKETEAEPKTEAEWLDELSRDPAFAGINVQQEHAKAIRWGKENRKQISRRRFINWLNRCDRQINSHNTLDLLDAETFNRTRT